MMMAAFLEYYGRDDEHDHLLSRSFGLPFGFSGDVVISDAARGLDGNLTIDGFDFGISAPRYLRFGDAGAVPSQLFARCAVAVIT
jgi:hypothetical protein